ncbi:MAG: VWA domain-containing protein [bacterium]
MHRFLFLTVLAAFAIPCQAAEFPEVVFILDSSGSMTETAGNQVKIAAAKAVLNQVIPQIPAEVRMGLAAYGHRKQMDCADVEMLIPPGSQDKKALLDRIASLQPLGMTPISLAVTQVADSLRGKTAETTIILVSDGVETCGGDPCAVVRALKQAGSKFVMHVVGFAVTLKDNDQLECIAREGGGTYFSAQDADSLLAALEAVRKEVAQKVEQARTTVVQKKTGLGKLQLVVPESALTGLSGFKIIRKDTGGVIKEAKFAGADSLHPLPSGSYALTLSFANSNYQPPTDVVIRDFEINGGETAQLQLGAISFNVAEGLPDLNVSAVILTDRRTDQPLLTTEPKGNDYYLYKTKAVPAGEYDVLIQYSRSPQSTVLATNVVVADGKETYVTLDTGIVLKRPQSSDVTGWDLLPAGSQSPYLQVRRGSDNNEPLWRRFMVQPGTYDLRVLVQGMTEPLDAAQGIEIKKGETLDFDTGL